MPFTQPTITGLLLGGGKSIRMGLDKRFLEVDGQPLLARSLDLLVSMGWKTRILISEADEQDALRELVGAEATFWIDPEPGQGPLAALAAALGRITTDWAFLLATDYPNLNGDFLNGLEGELKRHPKSWAVLPVREGIPQNLCGFYNRRLAASARGALDRGGRSLKGWLSEGEPPHLVPEGTWQTWTPSFSLSNWNRPQDRTQD